MDYAFSCGHTVCPDMFQVSLITFLISYFRAAVEVSRKYPELPPVFLKPPFKFTKGEC